MIGRPPDCRMNARGAAEQSHMDFLPGGWLGLFPPPAKRLMDARSFQNMSLNKILGDPAAAGRRSAGNEPKSGISRNCPTRHSEMCASINRFAGGGNRPSQPPGKKSTCDTPALQGEVKRRSRQKRSRIAIGRSALWD